MSIRVCIHNQDGAWIEMDRACFGFLSYIDQWGTDDVQDSNVFHEDSEDWGDEDDANGLEGFESGNLKSVDYIESVNPELLNNLKSAMAALPQYYGNVTISEETERGYNRVTFNIPLGDPETRKGLPMQPAVIGGMMLRNICQYTSHNNSFIKLIESGVEPRVAFVISQAFPYRINSFDRSKQGFYRSYGGDETIFKGEARLCDLAAMINGELGDNWQGVFGDTEEGYGRYGNYNGNQNSPMSDRTHDYKDLANITLITENYEDSPSLTRAKSLGCGIQEYYDRIFLPHEDMVKIFVPKLLELVK